jgi:hypothetical protein
MMLIEGFDIMGCQLHKLQMQCRLSGTAAEAKPCACCTFQRRTYRISCDPIFVIEQPDAVMGASQAWDALTGIFT